MPERIPLDLYAEVETADGARYRWDANQAPGSRLRGFSFRTKLGDGFSDATGQLARRIDEDYPDLELVQTVTVVGADGSTAYEGRLAAMPRELDTTHSIGVTLAGWMAHAKDRKFSEIYVDRDLGAWRGMTARRRANLLTNNFMPLADGQQQSSPEDSSAVVATSFQGAWVSPYKPAVEAWYDAGANTVAKVGYSWTKTSPAINPADNWDWHVAVCSDDIATASEATANLKAAGPSLLQTFTPTTARRWALLQLSYTTTPAGGEGLDWTIGWSKLAIYGNHGLTLRTGEPGEPDGVYVSDVLRNIVDRYCPKLNTDGVQDFPYVIQHCVFKDRVYPYDAFLELNKYALQHLAVWENRTLHFRPYDLSDYDWEIRTDDQGTTFSPQGPSTDDLFNGIVVTYTDLLTGSTEVITPDDDTTLADASTSNPWNQQGIEHWDEITLSSPVLAVDAAQRGRAALADKNRPKTPGTITVKGYIRDRAGVEQPVWKVRAGDRISVTNFPNDSPRLIVETGYDDETKTITLAIDRPSPLLDAFLERIANARFAKGLN